MKARKQAYRSKMTMLLNLDLFILFIFYPLSFPLQACQLLTVQCKLIVCKVIVDIMHVIFVFVTLIKDESLLTCASMFHIPEHNFPSA